MGFRLLPTLVAMLTQVNTLPDTQVKSAVSYWNANTATQEAIFYVGRHVVVAFIVMPVIGRISGTN